MSNETRVNLKHLLRDIRDSYTSPLEEVIITELIANALDSKASKIELEIKQTEKTISCLDNGQGMKRNSLKEYHNIASSTKTRGSGIGFAGLGAKLSLLLADKVTTESKGGYGSRCATSWYLKNPYRAPWKFIPSPQRVETSRGTNITIYLHEEKSSLLNEEFLKQTIIKHFYPLLIPKFYSEILKYLYKKPITFYINKKEITLPEAKQTELQHWFRISLGRSRQPVGVGFLVKTNFETNSWLPKILGTKNPNISLSPGVWTSTYGKVVKGGWEWLGIQPKNANNLLALVEIPAWSEILTTNKNDFLTDQKSLQKYYKYRKAIQSTILPILKQLGEDPNMHIISPDKLIKPINKTITSTLNQLVNDFPELEGLIDSKMIKAKGKKIDIKKDKSLTTENIDKIKKNETDLTDDKGKKEKIPTGSINDDLNKNIRAKTSGLKLNLADIKDEKANPLGIMMENNLTINTAHPAWLKAKQKGLEEYHIITVVANILSSYLDKERNPQDFLNRLLLAWANSEQNKAKDQLF